MDNLLEEQITRLVLEELSQNEAEKLHDRLAEDPEAMDFYLELSETVENTRRHLQELPALETTPKLTPKQKENVLGAQTAGSADVPSVIVEDDKQNADSKFKDKKVDSKKLLKLQTSYPTFFSHPFIRYIMPTAAACFLGGIFINSLFKTSLSSKTAYSEEKLAKTQILREEVATEDEVELDFLSETSSAPAVPMVTIETVPTEEAIAYEDSFGDDEDFGDSYEDDFSDDAVAGDSTSILSKFETNRTRTAHSRATSKKQKAKKEESSSNLVDAFKNGKATHDVAVYYESTDTPSEKTTKFYPVKPEAKKRLEDLYLTGDVDSKYVDSVGRLVVKGTKQDLALVEEQLGREGLIQNEIIIESKFAEATQKDKNELELDWTKDDQDLPAVGVNKLEIDSTLGKADFDTFIQSIDQKRNLDVLRAPKVTTTTGNPAVVEVKDERYLPTEFEDPEIIEAPKVTTKSGQTAKLRTVKEKFRSEQPIDAKAAVERARTLAQNQDFKQSINELEKLLVKQPYNVEANKELAKVYTELRRIGVIRRNAVQKEKISEVTWKWSNGPSTSPHSQRLDSSTVFINANTTPINILDNNIQISPTLNAKILQEQQAGVDLKTQMTLLGLELHPQAKLIHYPEFNRILIQNDKSHVTQNISAVTSSDKKIQVETQLKPLLKAANELYQQGQYQEAKQKLKEALQIQSQNIEAQKLLLETEAKLQPKKTQSKLFKNTVVEPMSTFAIDVDTASYTAARRKILNGQRPKPSEIRQEEFLNYFNYNYPTPKDQSFAIESELLPSPFIKGHHILRIGVQGKRPGADNKRPANTTFVIDTSGSMAAQSRLPLIQNILPMLLDKMNTKDKVSVITCDLNSRLIADKMPLNKKAELKKAIASLQAVGATNLEQSLLQAYKHAADNYENSAMNRIVLISDGVANLGETAAQNILAQVEKLRQMGITITVIGMGQGNYNDNFLETLANKADGSYIYIDSFKEAKKAFVDNFSAHFQLIARDVKIQVELDPNIVESYRLIGYDNRRLRNQDFRNDKVDGGEVGAGQSVTALYEVKLKGTQSTSSASTNADETSALPGLGEIRLRFKDPIYKDDVREFAFPLQNSSKYKFEKSSKASRLATLAATFAEYLRGGDYAQGIDKKLLNKLINELAIDMSYDDSVQELKRLITLTN